MGVLNQDTYERVAQAMYRKKVGQKKKELAVEVGINEVYFSSISRKQEVLDRIEELKSNESNKEIIGKNDRLKMLTDMLNEAKKHGNTDDILKILSAIDKMDDRIEATVGTKQIIIQLPDNNRSK